MNTEGAATVDNDILKEQLQAQLNAYDAAIAYIDHNLGLLFAELERRRVLDNTLVIITSDHGEEFGEHGVLGHGWNLHWLTTHVPLIISFPSRVPGGKVVREPVSLRDIVATVGDVLGLEGSTSMPGMTLARYWDGRPLTPDLNSDVLSELGGHAQDYKGTVKSITVGRYHYIRHGNGREELFDIENDALEKQNLANDSDGRQACARLRTRLETMLASK
jgi:arylsulfatase A-like enzyme